MTDALGASVSHITLVGSNQNASPVWTEETGKDGQPHAWSPYGHGNTDHFSLGFNGERIDPISRTYHLGNGYRAYNPTLMRFNCPDSLSPFGPGGINPYAYCAGDPINHADPSGHISVGAGIGVGLGVVGILGGAFALFTGGASIGVAGAIAAAIGFAADGTGIASAATEESDPQASATLGWVSLGLGIASGVVGAASFAGRLKSFAILKETDLAAHTDPNSKVIFYDYSNGKITAENGFTSNLFGERKLAVTTHLGPLGFKVSNEKRLRVNEFADFVSENFLLKHPDPKEEIHLLACRGGLHAQKLADIWQRPVIAYADADTPIWVSSTLKELASKNATVEVSRFQRIDWFKKNATPTRFDPEPRIMSSELRILEDGHLVI